MGEQNDGTLRSSFIEAQRQSKSLGSFTSASDPAYQENVRSAIKSFDRCREIASRISLFSPNETIEDVASGDLPFFQIDYYLGDLALKEIAADRKHVIWRARQAFDRYLHLLDDYRMLSRSASRLYERYTDDRDRFTLIGSNDAAMRRDSKIRRYKEEKELKMKLEDLAQNPKALEQDDAALRHLHRAHIDLSTHLTFETLDSVAHELKILAMKPPLPRKGPEHGELDYRERQGFRKDGFPDRLEPSLSSLHGNGKIGPILNKQGKPLQPFTLLGSRERLQNGVFWPDHALPTMTIDEYLDEERRRGGIINGGGEQSTRSATVDEDDIDRADAETMKAREWDEFVEANPKGSGNTINRG